MTFSAFITLIFLQTTGLTPQEANNMTVCEETVAIYQSGVTHTQLDQLITEHGWDPTTEFQREGCEYTEDGGVVIDTSTGQ